MMRQNPVMRAVYACAFVACASVASLSAASAQAEAATAATQSPMANSRWQSPTLEEAKRTNERNLEPPRVRIGLRLTPFKKVTHRKADNSAQTTFIPIEPLRHTLRARLNKVNHFFVGEWHVETRPMKWVKKSQRYEVQLAIYRRYGAFGQLEEHAGTVDLVGLLDHQEDQVFVLVGVARKRLRDNLGQPLVDVVAGFAPAAATAVSKAPSQGAPPAAPPLDYSGDLIRGRF